MLPTIHLTQLHEVLRTHTCATCPDRAPRRTKDPLTPRACEAHCPLFAVLPELVHRLNHRDPMLCPTEHLVAHALRTATPTPAPLRAGRDTVTHLLTRAAHLRG